MEAILFPLTILVLMTIHESGHVGVAKLLGLRVTSFGIMMKPIPHPYVAIKWSSSRPRVLAFFFAGVTLTSLQFGLMLLLGHRFLDQPIIYFAFCAQLILETNPFYSDFTLAHRFLAYPRKTEYAYTLAWYIHISLWVALIILLLSQRFLYGILFP